MTWNHNGISQKIYAKLCTTKPFKNVGNGFQLRKHERVCLIDNIYFSEGFSIFLLVALETHFTAADNIFYSVVTILQLLHLLFCLRQSSRSHF